MTTQERLKGFEAWAYNACCKGHKFKTPAPGMDITVIAPKVEPKTHLFYTPMRFDDGTWTDIDPAFVAPCMVIMPAASKARDMEEKRFDRYGGVHRPKGLGQHFALQVLFELFEDGVRLPGFVDKAEQSAAESAEDGEAGGYDMSLIREGTREGALRLFNWMDELKKKLLAASFIPNTDLFLTPESVIESPYTDQHYVVDKRPMYYGFMTLDFYCFADEAQNPDILKLLL